MILGWGALILAVLTVSVLGIVLAGYARFKGAWAIVGVTASALAILGVLAASAILLLVILAN